MDISVINAEVAMDVTQRQICRDWRILLWSLGIGPALSGLTWPRAAFQPAPPWDTWQALMSESDAFLAHLAGRFCTGLSILALIYIIVRHWPSSGVPKIGRAIWAGTLAVGAGFCASAAFGTIPSISIGAIGIPLLGTALFLLPPPDFGWLRRLVVSVCRLYVYGSLILVFVAFGWAVEYPYDLAYFSAFPYRLHGITINQANLGLLALILITLHLFAPFRSIRFAGILDVVLSMVVIITAQSKISIGLAGIILPLGIIVQFLAPISAFGNGIRVAAMCYTAALFSILWAIGGSGVLESWREVDPYIDSMTGRTKLWNVSLDLWSQNIIFGYGNTLWSQDMAAIYANELGWAPAQAHSQYVQSLGQTGALGFLFLLFYLWTLASASARCFALSSGLSTALVGILIIRGFSESWIRTFITDGNYLAHALVLALMFTGLRTAAQPSVDHREQAPLS